MSFVHFPQLFLISSNIKKFRKKNTGIHFLGPCAQKFCVPQHNFWSQKGNKLMTKFIIHFCRSHRLLYTIFHYFSSGLSSYNTDESSVSAVTSSATTFLCSSYYSLGLLLSSFFVLIVNVILMGPLK